MSAAGMQMKLTVRNTAGTIANLYRVDRQIKHEVQAAVLESATATLALTRQLCPVDTGFMRENAKATISPEVLAFEVGWDATDFAEAGLPFYPPFQEFGTRFMAAQPSLYPAYAHEQPIFVKALRAAVARAVLRRSA